MTLGEIIAITKDVLVAIAAATTAIVAVLGLKSWSRELKGKTEFEAARLLMKSTYKLRDELAYARSPFIRAGEFPEDYPGNMQENPPEREAQAWAYVYENRLSPVRDALQEFDTNLLEAEALWGGEIKQKGDDLRQCIVELHAAIEAVIEDKRNNGEDFKADREFAKSMRSQVSASRNSQDNQLNNKIKNAIDAIENQIQPHLNRS